MSEGPPLDRRLLEAIAVLASGIVAERVYPADEAALLLGLRGERAAKSIREIPPEVLPTVAISAGGKIKGYYGRDLIRYIRDRRDNAGPELDEAA